MDYYSILGIPKNASQDEIKKAYRKMAMKHHPDRGGDQKEFQKIQEAYETLGDESRRRLYDSPQSQFNNFSGFGHFHQHPFSDINEMFGFMRGGFNSRQQRNKSLTLKVQITLKEVLYGKEVIGSVTLPSGREQPLELKIPPGISHGDTIRYHGLGDDSIKELPRGDIMLQIIEVPDREFQRVGHDLIKDVSISIFDCLLGSKIRISNLEDQQIEINIPPGVTNNDTINCPNQGLPVRNGQGRGSLYVRINLSIPTFIDGNDKEIIKQLKYKYANR
jgi:curved DNA-binding protein